jgi:signal peptidase I
MDMERSEGAIAPRKAKESGRREMLRFLLILFVGTLLLRTLIVAPFSIPSGSMLPRMMIGDYLLVAKWPYGFSRYSMPFGIGGFDGRVLERTAERGDVVVFHYPGRWRRLGEARDRPSGRHRAGEGGTADAQRQAGAENPHRRLSDARDGEQPLPVPDPERKREVTDADGTVACAYPRYRETLPGGKTYQVLDQVTGLADETEVFRVPQGHYFVMGDNRDDSMDSRFPVGAKGVGLLPADHIVGRALITFFSTDGSSEWLKPWTWFTAARWERIGKTY